MNLDRRLLREMDGARGPLIATIGLGGLAGLLLVAQAYGLSRAISRVFLDGQDLGDVAPLLAALALIAVGRALALGSGELAAHTLADRIKGALRERLLAHLAALGPAYVRGERSGELANTAVEGIEALHAYLGEYIPQLVLAALVPLTMLAVVFPLDLLSGLVLLLTAPMIPLLMILIGKAANRQSHRQWTQLSRMSAHFLDALQGLPTLKMFGQSRAQVAVIGTISDRFRDATMSVLRIAFLSALVLEMLATISTAIIAVEIGLRLLYGRMELADALFILILAPEYYLPLRMLGTRFHAGVAGVTAAGRIFAVLETPVPGCQPVALAPTPVNSGRPSEIQQFTSPPTSLRLACPLHAGRGGGEARQCRAGGEVKQGMATRFFDRFPEVARKPASSEVHRDQIRFEDVRVVYNTGERPALDGISLHLPRPDHRDGRAERRGQEHPRRPAAALRRADCRARHR